VPTLKNVAAAPYRGRFAPSPTGALHAGSLVAALASWLDARAHSGQWLIRIEDVDTPRCQLGADQLILQQLATCGLLPDAPPLYQSQRGAVYQQALNQLVAANLAYPCGCTRQDIARALAAAGYERERHGELVYPGTCRSGLHGKAARAWRFLTVPDEAAEEKILWQDRRLGPQSQNVSREVGDFILKRADGLWAYQLAVVVDDAAQGITDIVRGQDLTDNTARQILLQRALNLPLPRYLHTPLALGANGEKLSKQNGAQALELSQPLAALNQAAALLGLRAHSSGPVADALQAWISEWKDSP
jgi:glutamyl-Q tRNA(Asp) synthetase